MKCASCTRGELLQEEHLVRPAHIRSSWELWHGEPSQTAFTLTGGNKRGLCIFNITIVIKSHGSASLSHSKTSLCFWLPGWQIYNQSVDKEFLGWKVLLLPWMSPCGWDFTFRFIITTARTTRTRMYTSDTTFSDHADVIPSCNILLGLPSTQHMMYVCCETRPLCMCCKFHISLKHVGRSGNRKQKYFLLAPMSCFL